MYYMGAQIHPNSISAEAPPQTPLGERGRRGVTKRLRDLLPNYPTLYIC